MIEDALPTVSAIVPCFNQAKYLPDALESLLKQTVGSWECIVIDDGSTDDTVKVAREFSRLSPKIRCISQENKGASGARNMGLRQVSGKYIQFLDADDFIAPDKWEKQLALLDGNSDLSVCLCDYAFTDAEGQKFREHPCYKSPRLDAECTQRDIAMRWETDLSVPIHCFLFDSRVFNDRMIRFDESLDANEDWDCWMRVFAVPVFLAYNDEKLAFYRQHNGSKTRDRANMRRSFLQAIGKQQRLCKDDQKLQAILARKAETIKHLYRDCVLPWSAWHILRSSLRRLINGAGMREVFSVHS
jgi:hypothetical protein